MNAAQITSKKIFSFFLIFIVGFLFTSITRTEVAEKSLFLDSVQSIIDQKRDAVVLVYRESCPLSAYFHSLFDTMQQMFRKQLRNFIAIEADLDRISDYKLYNISDLPSLLLFKKGKFVWRYTSKDSLNKSMLEQKIRSIYDI